MNLPNKSINILIMIILLLLSLTPYLYLLKAQSHPLMNWGELETSKDIFDHIIGEQYRWRFQPSIENSLTNLQHLFSSILVQFNFFLILFVFSLFSFKKINLPEIKFFALLTIIPFIFAINYQIIDVDIYFISLYLFITLIMAIQISFFFKIFQSTLKVILLTFSILLFLSTNLYYLNQISQITEKKQDPVYTNEILTQIPQDSLLITNTNPNGFFYSQYVLGINPHLQIIHKKLLTNEWYIKQLKRKYPNLVIEAPNFYENEKGLISNNDNFEYYERKFANKIIDDNKNKISIYLTQGEPKKLILTKIS